ncbi:MAG: hypothetical protein R3F61_04085 [Myxococcota bacterium]
MSGKNDDEDKLPDVARRRGNADTLFSADWFEDEDNDSEPAPPAPPAEKPAGGKPMWMPAGATPVTAAPPAPPAPAPPAPAAPPAPPADPTMSAPAMISEPPPPPRVRSANPTILPDFDFDDDTGDVAAAAPAAPPPVAPPAAPPPVAPPAPAAAAPPAPAAPPVAPAAAPPVAAAPPPVAPPAAAPPPITAKPPSPPSSPPDNLPEVAKRRGNADTLFSADWFDDDDNGTAAEADADDAPAAEKPKAKAKAPPKATEASIGDVDDWDEPAPKSNLLLYVGIAGVLMFLGCAGMGTGIALVLMLKG